MVATAVPVLTAVVASAGGTTALDNCGYAKFPESGVVRAGVLVGTRTDRKVAVFYGDERALTLGVNPNVTPMPNAPTVPQHVTNPNTGDQSANGNDSAGRPMAPSLFLTDLTVNGLNSKAGDFQAGGPKNSNPNDLWGTWKPANRSATGVVTPGPDPAKNNLVLGSGADTNPTPGSNEGFSAEVRWNATGAGGLGLTAGHTYRVQVMTHDGDIHADGDAGEFCTNVTIPGPPTIETSPSSNVPPFGPFQIQTPIRSSINDTVQIDHTASLGPGVTAANCPTAGAAACGSVTTTLHFVPNGTAIGNDPCTTGQLKATYSNIVLAAGGTGGQDGVATTPNYDTSADNSLGTYFWQSTYNPPNPIGNYTTATETCTNEVVQIVNTRVRINPPSATNIVNNAHVLTATVERTVDGTTWTGVSGVAVTFSYIGATSATPNPPTGCNTGAAGTCTTSINDAVPELVTIRATATNFEVPASGSFAPGRPYAGNLTDGNVGLFTRQTGDAGCANDTCDAQKLYINPKTALTVSDTLIGLGATATGSVEYKVFANATCAGSGTSLGTVQVGAGGVVPTSPTVTVDPGETKWFVAYYTGNEGTFHTDCSAETASSAA